MNEQFNDTKASLAHPFHELNIGTVKYMIMIDGRADLLSMNLTELGEFLAELGVEKYRAKQIYGWMVRGVGFDNMTNLPKALRERLAE